MLGGGLLMSTANGTRERWSMVGSKVQSCIVEHHGITRCLMGVLRRCYSTTAPGHEDRVTSGREARGCRQSHGLRYAEDMNKFGSEKHGHGDAVQCVQQNVWF